MNAGFLGELQRRNVIRMAGLYLVGGWLLVQVASTLFPAFGVPAWALRALVIVLALGAAPALVFSWVFELTPDGLRRDAGVPLEHSIAPQTAHRLDRIITAMLALALVYFAVDKFVLAPRREQAQIAAAVAAPARAATAVADDNSIAVLPFLDMSQAKDQEYFSDGLSEELLNQLAQVPQLRVIARTSSFSFKGKGVPIADIARALNVAHVLEGSVRKSGNTLRITAQLIRASDSTNLWSSTYDRSLDDVFKVQDEISREVVSALKLQLLPEKLPDNTQRTKNPQAYEQYLIGREAARTGGRPAVEAALAAFQRAVALDPGYSNAVAQVGNQYGSMTDFQDTPAQREAMIDRSIATATRAIEIAPDLPDGYSVRGSQRFRLRWDWQGGQADIARALELNPNRAPTLAQNSFELSALGRFDEAIVEARKAANLDPLSDEAWTQLGRALTAKHADAEARQAFERALVLNPQQNWANFLLGNLLLAQGKLDEAMAHYQRAPDQFRTTGTAMVEFSRGHQEAANEALHKLETDYPIGFAYQIAQVYAWRGQSDKAFEWLERCLEIHDAGLARLLYDPAMDPLRSDPRFAALVAKIGIPEMSLFAELKRRNVAKVGAAYLLVAWLVVQAASIGFPAFDAPPWALRVFILVLLLGFPIAVVMAWMLEITPEGLKVEAAPSGNKRIVAIAIVLATLAVLWYYRGQPSLRQAAIPVGEIGARAPTAPKELPKSIAVLPFVNMSADAGNESFSDGISEELLNVLVKVPELGVASRTSSFAFKGKELGAGEIAKALKVSYILEGSVRKEGDKVRITAQLIDAVHDRHLWSETYDRQLTDIFAIQSEIANAIVVALRGSLTAAKPAAVVKVDADTENMQAYELYLKARENFIARRDLSETVKMFERVVALDPKFARGWEGMAAAASVAPSWGLADRDYMALAAQAADRALELDPRLSMPWAVRAQIVTDKWPIDFATALSDFDKAVAADPRNATALLWRGITWTKLGFFDHAIADLSQAVVLEPNYLNAIRHKALALLLAGREDAAFALYDTGLDKGFVNSRTENFIAPMLAHGRRAEALLLMGVDTMSPQLRDALILKLDHPQAHIADVRALVARHAEDPEVSQATGHLTITQLYLWLGDYDAVATSDDRVTTTIVAWDRYPPSFRNSPGMKAKLASMGVVDYWRAKGFPPQCHPVGDQDFNCD